MLLLDYYTKFRGMREVGKYTTLCLDLVSAMIKPGISTEDINQFVKKFGEDNNLINAQYQYKVRGSANPYPAYACTSLNEVMCHGVPSPKTILKEGDLIKVDVTFIKDGWHGDACRTFIVDETDDFSDIALFVNDAQTALWTGVEAAIPGVELNNVGAAIEDYVKSRKLKVSKDFVGHGIGLGFHEALQVSHFDDPTNFDARTLLQPGMTFTIEPIINMKTARYRTLKDGWSVATRDKSLSAQFEATIGITPDGNEVFCE